MGYYSKVMIIVSKNGYSELTDYVENLSQQNEVENLLKYAQEETVNERYITLTWNWLKWDDQFVSVKNVIEGLSFIKSKGYSYEYGIIGEEYGDVSIEHSKGCDDDLPTLEVETDFATYF